MESRYLVRAAFGALLLVAACRARSAAVGSPRGARDAAVDVAPPATRVVSLVPSTTEMIFALGAGATVVGVSAFDDYPPEVTARPRVGGMVNPSFEAIVALRPDAVVGVEGPLDTAVIDRLRAMGVRTLFPRVESMEEVHASIDLFAALLHRQQAARALHASIRRDVDRVRAAVRGRTPPRVLAVFGQRPLVVAGPGSWFDEILSIAGGVNVMVGGNRYPMVSLEQVLAAAPEVVVDLTWHEGHGRVADALATYTSVPAVRDHRVVAVDNPLLIRQGPRIGEAAVLLARTIHPGLSL